MRLLPVMLVLHGFASVSMKKRTVMYEIVVKTTDVTHAGTDAHVGMVIASKYRRTRQLELDTAWHNDFQRGARDTYWIEANDVVHVKTVVFGRTNMWAAPAWHLEYIIVKIPSRQQSAFFPYNKWVPAHKHITIHAYNQSGPTDNPFASDDSNRTDMPYKPMPTMEMGFLMEDGDPWLTTVIVFLSILGFFLLCVSFMVFSRKISTPKATNATSKSVGLTMTTQSAEMKPGRTKSKRSHRGTSKTGKEGEGEKPKHERSSSSATSIKTGKEGEGEGEGEKPKHERSSSSASSCSSSAKTDK